MDNQLIYQGHNSMISIQSLYFIGGYITYRVFVSTNSFSGICCFCINENKLTEYIQIVDKMIQSLDGEIEILDCESDAYLKFYFENDMNFYVIGQIGGSYEDNMLKFKFRADQTVLLGLREKLLNYENQ
ncbi:MAG: hypothetical protein IJ040_01375 [Lachnospiraceae bacterium]|nr:hypothetical protein [Lachnospiraceae bacterium]